MPNWEKLSSVEYPRNQLGESIWFLQEDYRYGLISDYDFIIHLDFIFDIMMGV